MFPRLIVSSLFVLLVALGSQVSYGSDPDFGILRLSWKTVGEKIHVQADQQDEDVPVHMRANQGSADRMRDYRLTVEIDGKVWMDKLLRPPGLHHDRPISVFEELKLPPGEHAVWLKFWPVPDDGATWKPEIRKTLRIEKGAIETLEVEAPIDTESRQSP